MQTIKCTHNAATSIALVCAEMPYEQASLVLQQLAGLDVNTMSEFRATDSIGSEFVVEPPVSTDLAQIGKMAQNRIDNVLEFRVAEMSSKNDNEEIIKKAIKDGAEGVFYKDYDGTIISAMYVECDGTGVPGRRKELAGVSGKQADGSAKTFEAKIGAVFTVEYTADGKPLLNENGEIRRSSEVRYTGTVRRISVFGPMLYHLAVKNGLHDADAVIFLGDGAKWVWNIQKSYFPNSLTCLDLYHAIEHVNDLIDMIQFKGRSGQVQKEDFKNKCIDLLRCGKIHDMIEIMEGSLVKKGKEGKFESGLGYFRSNIERMNYGIFSVCGLYVGSGVIEAACKVIVGNRMKNAGMHWSKNHAEKMIALRCAIRNKELIASAEGTSALKSVA